MYITIFLVSFVLSTFFAIGGVGSAVAIVPIMHFLGLPFDFSKAIGLFVNTSTTITATFMNLKRKTLDIKFALPLAITLALFAPLGAIYSKYISVEIVKLLFGLSLFFSASMILFGKKEQKYNIQNRYIILIIGAIIGVFSGLLGIGGGSLLLPILILIGYDAKKVATALSFIIPFSTLSAFLTYINFIEVDWFILIVSAVGAILGGYVGNYLMHFKLNPSQIKKIIAILLYIISLKMIFF